MTEIKNFFAREDVKTKFKQLLGEKSNSFITSVLQVISEDKDLMLCDIKSIYNASVMSAMLDLPVAKGFGFAFIIPYKDQNGWVAQFQVGYKGFMQLAQKSGLFKSINSTPIYEGQLVEYNPLDGHVFDLKLKYNNTVIGYAAKFILLNGFEAVNFMTIAEIQEHGNKYSDQYRSRKGIWFDNFDVMANKTVLKLLLTRQAPLSLDMQKALVVDQSVIQDVEEMKIDYVDNKKINPKPVVNKEEERLMLMMQDCKDINELLPLKKHIKSKKTLLEKYKEMEILLSPF